MLSSGISVNCLVDRDSFYLKKVLFCGVCFRGTCGCDYKSLSLGVGVTCPVNQYFVYFFFGGAVYRAIKK